MGHNSETEQERVKKQQFFKLLSSHNGYKSDRASADSEIKGVYQRAATFGITKEHFKYAQMFQDPEKEADFMKSLQTMMEVAEWMGAKPSRQLSLNLNDRTPQADIAYTAGYRVGAMAGDARNPYHEGSKEGQAWQKGFHDGDDLRRAELRANVTEQEQEESAPWDGEEEEQEASGEPEKKKRGRPPKKTAETETKTQDDADWDSAAPAPASIN